MLIAYVYDRKWNILGQLFSVQDFSCTLKMNAVSQGELIIGNNDSDNRPDIVKFNNRISVYREVPREDAGTTEKLLIDGYIAGIESTLFQTKIIIKNMLGIFEQRIFQDNKSYTTNMTYKSIMEDIFSQANKQGETYLKLDCDVEEKISDKQDFEKGNEMFNALKELAQDTYHLYARWDTIFFNHRLGIDRADPDSSEFFLFEWDYFSNRDRNINDASFLIDEKEFCNAVLVNANKTYAYYEDAESINTYGKVQRSISANGNAQQTAEDYVEVHKVPVPAISIDPMNIDFFVADIGDLVRVFIRTQNNHMAFDGVATVIEKKFTRDDIPQISFKISESITIPGENFFEKTAQNFDEVEKRLKKLEMQ